MADKFLRTLVLAGLTPPTQIVNQFSGGGVESSQTAPGGAITALSGSTTAGVLKTVLSITGSGVLQLAVVAKNNATSRSARLRLTIDGIVVFDATGPTAAAGNQGLAAVANYVSTTQLSDSEAPFRQSCLIEVASSLTETDGLKTFYKYYLT